MSAVAETYTNTLYDNHPCARWWLAPRILIGGSILSAADWQHLAKDFEITDVINVEVEHTDAGYGIPSLLELPTFDDGWPKTFPWFLAGCRFASIVSAAPERRLYIHCQMGGSRSPLMGYAILRKGGSTVGDALERIHAVHPGWGDHVFHRFYLASADAALTMMRGEWHA